MLLTDFSKIIIVDATSAKLKVALCENGKISEFAQVNGQAMECFFQALEQVCKKYKPIEIEAFALCTGTGSILGTRSASVAIATIANFSNAKIFEYNCMEVAAYAIANTNQYNFSLFTPSRKGYVNILNFEEKIKLLKEIKIDEISEFSLEKKIVLWQRDKIDVAISEFPTFYLDEKSTLEVLVQNPHLASICEDTPDAKPLTEREYVKWKAQAHI